MKEYKIAKGWSIFIYITAPLLFVLFGWMITQMFPNGDFSPNTRWIYFPLVIVMMVIIVIAVIDTFKSRFIIAEDKIISKSTLSNRELRFEEIKGYSIQENNISIEPIDPQQKRIKVSHYVDGNKDILDWLSQSFPDLEVQIAKEEEEGILNDWNHGQTKESREEKLLKAKRKAKILNVVGGAIGAWVFFYPTPYQLSMVIAIVFPIIVLLVSKFSDGLIRMKENKKSAYPSVVFAFIFPAMALVMRALLDYTILDFSNVWSITILITVVLSLVLLYKQTEFHLQKNNDVFYFIFLVFFFFGYSYGVVIHLNCYYDNSQPEYFTAEVLDKKISTGKTTSYYLKISPWEKQKETEEIDVDKDLYDRTEAGDEVGIYFRKGNLDIPWIVVTDE